MLREASEEAGVLAEEGVTLPMKVALQKEEVLAEAELD